VAFLFGDERGRIFLRRRTNMLSNMKAALAARRMHQVELAEAVGIGRSVLSAFIYGRAQLSPQLRARIAEVLKADPEWLFSSATHIPEPKIQSTPDRSASAFA
jgi:transcriptional regulator with XRE-family HTH domain